MLSFETSFLSVNTKQFKDLLLLKLDFIRKISLSDPNFNTKLQILWQIENFIEILEFHLRTDEINDIFTTMLDIILRRNNSYISYDEESDSEEEEFGSSFSIQTNGVIFDKKSRESKLVEPAYSIIMSLSSSSLAKSSLPIIFDVPTIKLLLENFNWISPPEKEFFKLLIHRIYGQIVEYREATRNLFLDFFEDFLRIEENFVRKHHRAASVKCILEVFGTIVSGFWKPLKNTHKMLLNPFFDLTRSVFLHDYFDSLGFVIVEFCRKDSELLEASVNKVVTNFEMINTSVDAQVLNLRLLEGILEQCQDKIVFRRISVNAIRVISRFIPDINYNLSQQALQMLRNEFISILINRELMKMFPFIYPALRELTDTHWNLQLRQAGGIVLMDFIEQQPVLFKAALRSYQKLRKHQDKIAEERDKIWELVDGVTSQEGKPESSQSSEYEESSDDSSTVMSYRSSSDENSSFSSD